MSKLDLTIRNGRQEEVLDESIVTQKIKQDNFQTKIINYEIK
jgi:hypothetical protein